MNDRTAKLPRVWVLGPKEKKRISKHQCYFSSEREELRLMFPKSVHFNKLASLVPFRFVYFVYFIFCFKLI